MNNESFVFDNDEKRVKRHYWVRIQTFVYNNVECQMLLFRDVTEL